MALIHLFVAFHGLRRAFASGERLSGRLLNEQPYIPLRELLLCLAAAACYAASSVLEQREARRAPTPMTLRLGLLGHLLRRPLWLIGTAAGFVGFALQFLALRRGSLELVQPLLVIGLVFALAGDAALDHRWLSRGEMTWTAITMIGLAVFLIVSQPGPGRPRGSDLGWALLGLIMFVVVGALVLLSRARPRWRALSLGIAAGVASGVLSALIERTAHLLSRGLLHTLVSWPTYALGVCAILGLTLTQSAFQAGDIRRSLPALTVVEPIVAILIGQLLFGEHISFVGLAPVVELFGLVLMSLGVFGLAQARELQLVEPAG